MPPTCARRRPHRHELIHDPAISRCRSLAYRIVGYSIADRMKAQLAVDALTSAVARRGGPAAVAGCVVHSDRRSQFRSRKSVRALPANHLVESMGRVGAAGDNARYGVPLRPAAEERREPPPLGHPRPATPGGHHLDPGPTTAADAHAPSADSPRPSTR